MHQFQLEFVAISTKRDIQIEALQKSDSEQWKVIRNQQLKIMGVLYGFAGGLAVLIAFDIPAKIIQFIKSLTMN